MQSVQSYIPSQQIHQILGSTLNLLQTVASRFQTPHNKFQQQQQQRTITSSLSSTSPNLGPAAQLLRNPVFLTSLNAPSCPPLLAPQHLPSAHSLLSNYVNALPHTRSFHQSHSLAPTFLRRSRDVSRFQASSPPFSPSRYISLFRSQPLPHPRTLAQIQLLETSANASPSYVPAQIAYFQALIDSGLPKAAQRVINRWERVLEFDQSNPLLRSDEAFQLYLTALVQTDNGASVDHAVQRREQVLAHPPMTEAPKVESNPEASISATTPVQPANANANTTPDKASHPSLSNSQQIAQTVLATRMANSFSVASGSSGLANKLLGVANNLTGSGSPGGGKENPIFVSLSEPRGSVWYRIVRFVVLTAMGGFFILVLMAVLLENSGLLKTSTKGAAEFEPVEGKVVKFSDVHGVDEAKEELQEIVEFLKDPTNFATLGGKLPKGVLLTGPPGTGKTMLARAVAGEAGVPFLFASGSEFDEMFVGIGAKRIRDLFASARKRQPSIIFIDELDAIGSKRSPKDQHYMKQTLNQLLVELDGFQQSEGVIVIAATNFPQSLDQALVRPGRFDRKITVPLPDVKGRVQILKHHMKNVITSEEVDPVIIARGTPGFSGADLQNMVNQAAIQASREGYKYVELKHFEWARDRILMGAERRSIYIEPKAKLLTAYHEGGHALVALYTEGAMPLHKVTCMPRGNALGYTAQLPEDDRFSVSFKEFVAEMDVCMGGRVAEELVYGPENVTSGCISDIAHATDVATRMVQNYGYSSKLGPVFFDDQQVISGDKRKEIEAEIRTLVEAAQNRAKRLLTEKEEELHRLAAALVEHETLDLEEVKKVIRGERIRENENLSEA